MTATQVNGLAVMADEPTLSPITGPNGAPIYWRQTRTLLLEDETKVFGCVHCDYTADNPHKVRPHLKVHREPEPEPAAGLYDLPLSDLLARVAELEKLTADRDTWKRRALKAERSLATMRRALNT
ncbi:hypothetical protein [Actinomadura decatromicini]|uniref:C2H2-type domain-containing protein n=1 Tax=Actinomadura decatromicini TaxID=2604572 RepID=A0A5D3FH32_9ACTN|nr:hypothetical protein [Actinomadura decatromicini]TYK47176.1 hypothetical protein FXF68_25595 [Actinomadura decatromicini]